MRSCGLCVSLLLALSVATGCQPAEPPAVPVVTAPVQVAEPPHAPAYELTPVAEPGEVVAIGRWKNPGATVTALASCAGVPDKFTDMGRTELPAKLLEGLFGHGEAQLKLSADLGALVAIDAPVDVIATLNPTKGMSPRMNHAISVGLRSLEGAKGALEAAGPLVEMVPGMWRVGEKDGKPTCAVVASAGATPARLVCAEQDRDVIALAPYATRTLSTMPSAARDIHFEIRTAALEGRFGGELQEELRKLPGIVQSDYLLGEPSFDRTMIELTNAFSEELVNVASDLSKITLDASVDPASCLSLTAGIELRGKSSGLASILVDRAERNAAPPAIFWRAPADSDTASYAQATDPARAAHLLEALRTLAHGALVQAKLGSEADREALVNLIAIPTGKDASVVQAAGHLDAPTLGEKPTPQQEADVMMAGLVGWHMIGVTEGPDGVTKLIKNTVATYQRNGILSRVKKELGKGAKLMPAIRLVPAPKELGAGALAVEAKFAFEDEKLDAAAGRKTPSHLVETLHLLLSSDGKNTWVAFGLNKPDLVKRLLMTKAGAPEADTLASRKDLAPLKEGKHLHGGFVTATPIIKAVRAATAIAPQGTVSPDVAQLVHAFSALPHAGATPNFVTVDVTSGGTLRGELSLGIPKNSLQDLGAVMMSAIRF